MESNFLCFLRVMLEQYSEGGNQRETSQKWNIWWQIPYRYAIYGLQVTQAKVLYILACWPCKPVVEEKKETV